MYLVIGGSYQGKYQYAVDLLETQLGRKATDAEKEQNIVRNLHDRVFDSLNQLACNIEFDTMSFSDEFDRELDKIEAAILEVCEEKIVTCNEVGMGIVPMDRQERIYRELVGRILRKIAAKSEGVFRMMAGIPVKIK